MSASDYIVLAVILLILGVAAWFIIKSKKSGKKCIGCPDSCAHASGNCGCACGGCGSGCSNEK